MVRRKARLQQQLEQDAAAAVTPELDSASTLVAGLPVFVPRRKTVSVAEQLAAELQPSPQAKAEAPWPLRPGGPLNQSPLRDGVRAALIPLREFPTSAAQVAAPTFTLQEPTRATPSEEAPAAAAEETGVVLGYRERRRLERAAARARDERAEQEPAAALFLPPPQHSINM